MQSRDPSISSSPKPYPDHQDFLDAIRVVLKNKDIHLDKSEKVNLCSDINPFAGNSSFPDSPKDSKKKEGFFSAIKKCASNLECEHQSSLNEALSSVLSKLLGEKFQPQPEDESEDESEDDSEDESEGESQYQNSNELFFGLSLDYLEELIVGDSFREKERCDIFSIYFDILFATKCQLRDKVLIQFLSRAITQENELKETYFQTLQKAFTNIVFSNFALGELLSVELDTPNFKTIEENFIKLTQEAGVVNQPVPEGGVGGPYGELQFKYSLFQKYEADHVPPESVMLKHPKPLKPRQMPSVIIPSNIHRKLLTSGSSKKAKLFRKEQEFHVKEGKVWKAIEMNLGEYWNHNLVKDNKEGIRQMIDYHRFFGMIPENRRKHLKDLLEHQDINTKNPFRRHLTDVKKNPVHVEL